MKELEKLIKNSGISPSDRAAVLDVFTKYHRVNRRRISPEKTFFYRSYFGSYNRLEEKGDTPGKDLLVKALHRISELSDTTVHIGRGLRLCSNFLDVYPETHWGKLFWNPLSKKTVDLWIKSLEHLETDWPDNPSKSVRLGRYLNISEACLSGHPSQDFVLELLIRKGQLYSLENFMFGLAESQDLDEKKAGEYFANLRKIPLDARVKIEDTRKKVKQKELPKLDPCLYELFSLKSNTDSSRRASASLIYRVAKFHLGDPTKYLEEIIKAMGEIAETESSIMEELLDYSIRIFRIGQSFKKPIPLLKPYLEVIKYLAELEAPYQEKQVYLQFSGELFEDYYRKNGKTPAPREIQKKCRKGVNGFLALEDETRAVSLQLFQTSIEKMNRDSRLGRKKSDRLYADNLAETVIKAASLNSNQATDFLTALVDYENFQGERNERK